MFDTLGSSRNSTSFIVTVKPDTIVIKLNGDMPLYLDFDRIVLTDESGDLVPFDVVVNPNLRMFRDTDPNSFILTEYPNHPLHIITSRPNTTHLNRVFWTTSENQSLLFNNALLPIPVVGDILFTLTPASAVKTLEVFWYGGQTTDRFADLLVEYQDASYPLPKDQFTATL
jgi:hypothetical protein